MKLFGASVFVIIQKSRVAASSASNTVKGLAFQDFEDDYWPSENDGSVWTTLDFEESNTMGSSLSSAEYERDFRTGSSMDSPSALVRSLSFAGTSDDVASIAFPRSSTVIEAPASGSRLRRSVKLFDLTDAEAEMFRFGLKKGISVNREPSNVYSMSRSNPRVIEDSVWRDVYTPTN